MWPLSRTYSTNAAVQSATLHRPCRCGPCIAVCSPGSATNTGCSVPPSWHRPSCKHRRFRSGRSRDSIPNADAPKTRLPPVRQSKQAESVRLLANPKADVCGLSCSCFYYATLRNVASSKKWILGDYFACFCPKLQPPKSQSFSLHIPNKIKKLPWAIKILIRDHEKCRLCQCCIQQSPEGFRPSHISPFKPHHFAISSQYDSIRVAPAGSPTVLFGSVRSV